MAWLRKVLDPPDEVRENMAKLQARPPVQGARERASTTQQLLRFVALVWGLVVGGLLCLAAFQVWLWWWIGSIGKEPLNPALIPLAVGALLVIGAVLIPFFPRFGGALTLLAATCLLGAVAIFFGEFVAMSYFGRLDPGWDDRISSIGFLVLLASSAGPGILALLSARPEAQPTGRDTGDH
jgi:hypothetical protein